MPFLSGNETVPVQGLLSQTVTVLCNASRKMKNALKEPMRVSRARNASRRPFGVVPPCVSPLGSLRQNYLAYDVSREGDGTRLETGVQGGPCFGQEATAAGDRELFAGVQPLFLSRHDSQRTERSRAAPAVRSAGVATASANPRISQAPGAPSKPRPRSFHGSIYSGRISAIAIVPNPRVLLSARKRNRRRNEKKSASEEASFWFAGRRSAIVKIVEVE